MATNLATKSVAKTNLAGPEIAHHDARSVLRRRQGKPSTRFKRRDSATELPFRRGVGSGILGG